MIGAVRDDDPEFDVFLTGTVFFDIIFIGLEAAPKTGTEVWASGMGSGPGGVANLAVACSRLGLKTSLAAAFGEDLYGDYCRQTLGIQEGVDLTYSRYVTGWHSPVTVSMVYERERTMVTHGHLPEVEDQLVRQPPRARVSFIDLGNKRSRGSTPSPTAAASSSPTSAGTRRTSGISAGSARACRAATRSLRTRSRR